MSLARQAWQAFVRWDLASVSTALVIVCGALALFVPPFRSHYNLNALAFTVAVTGVVALSQVCALAVAQFNLALTAIGAMSGIVTAWLMQVAGLPYGLAIVLGIAFGCLAGALQGLVIVLSRINPFVVTLALAATYFGGMLGVLRGASFNRLPPAYVALGRATILGVPLLPLVSLVVAVLVAGLFGRTVGGRVLLATGANARAAAMSGIPIGLVVVIAHLLSGGLAAIAAIMLVARLGSAQPSLGSEWLLPSFAAAVLGGTLLTGGKVQVAGAILGALLLAVIANGLVLFGVSAYWYQALLGVILLLALSIEKSRHAYVMRRQL